METFFTLLELPTWQTTAISIQCLFNHPKMPSIFYQVTASHPNHCKTGQLNILMLRKFLIRACALLK